MQGVKVSMELELREVALEGLELREAVPEEQELR